jgi:hypothetical protein
VWQYAYKHLTLYNYKHMMLCVFKQMMLYGCKHILLSPAVLPNQPGGYSRPHPIKSGNPPNQPLQPADMVFPHARELHPRLRDP